MENVIREMMEHKANIKMKTNINRHLIKFIFTIIIRRPTFAYYGLCILIGKLVEYTLMAPLYIIILIPRTIIIGWMITRRIK